MTPDAGWARGAAIFGYVSAAVIFGLTVAVINSSDGDTARNLGIAATVYAAGSIPVIEIGGASARNYPMVRGAPGLRVASWIGYVVTLIDAATLIGVSYSSPVDSGHVLSVGLLGSLSAVGFAIDAQISASDANALRKQMGYSKVDGSLKLAPVVTTARTHDGAVVPTFGLRAAF